MGHGYVEVGVRMTTYSEDAVTFSGIYSPDGQQLESKVMAWQPFSNGLAAVRTPDGWQLKDHNWQTVPLTANRYPIRRFGARNLERVVVETLGGVGLYDLKRQAWQIQPAYDDMQLCEHPTLVFAQDSGRWGVLDVNGQWALEPVFDKLFTMRDSLVVADYNGQQGLVALSGDVLINFDYDAVSPHAQGYRLVNYSMGRLSGELNQAKNAAMKVPIYGFANRQGELLYDAQYRNIWPLRDGFILETAPEDAETIYYLYNGQRLYPPGK